MEKPKYFIKENKSLEKFSKRVNLEPIPDPEQQSDQFVILRSDN